MTFSRSALITGASRGIGLSIADVLAARGYDLTVSARTQSDVDRVAARLESSYGISAQGVAADLSQPSELDQLVAAHAARFPRMDALVLNAGMGSLGSIERLDSERVQQIFQVNFGSAVQLFQAALPYLRAAADPSPGNGARVIALASILGVYPQPKLGAYAASKAALRSLVESINLEHSESGISATAICPGYVATDMTAWLKDTVHPDVMIRPDDIAHLVGALVALSSRAVVNEIVVSRAGTDGRIA